MSKFNYSLNAVLAVNKFWKERTTYAERRAYIMMCTNNRKQTPAERGLAIKLAERMGEELK